MPDYAAMYLALFRSQTKAIEILQKAQRQTEEMYISAPVTDIRILDTKQEDEKNGEAQR